MSNQSPIKRWRTQEQRTSTEEWPARIDLGDGTRRGYQAGVTVVGLVGDLERGTTAIGAWNTCGEFPERSRTRSACCARVARLPLRWENTGWNEAKGHQTESVHANGVVLCG